MMPRGYKKLRTQPGARQSCACITFHLHPRSCFPNQTLPRKNKPITAACPSKSQDLPRYVLVGPSKLNDGRGENPIAKAIPQSRGVKMGCRGGSGEREVMGKQHGKGSTRDACWKAPALRQSMRDSGPWSWETGLHQTAEEKHIRNTSTTGEAARSYHQEDVQVLT